MRFGWNPQVYERLIIDDRFNRYLILNADYADWVFLHEDRFHMFRGLQKGDDPATIIKEYMLGSSLTEREALEDFKELLAHLSFHQIVFPSHVDHKRVSKEKKSSLEVTYINITEACNLRCPYCYAEAGREAKDELTQEEIKEVILSSKALGARKIVFTGGEPFLREEIFSLGSFVKEEGLLSEVITNGTCIKEHDIERIEEAFHGVAISLEGSTKELHEMVRGKDTFEVVHGAIELLSNTKIDLIINTVITKLNYHDIHDLSLFVAEMRSSMHNTFMHLPLGRGAEDGLSCNLEEIRELRQLLLESIHQHQDDQFIQRRIETAPPKRGITKKSCGAGQTEILVNSCGDVYPCRLLQIDGQRGGNIRTSSLEEIYHSSKSLHSCRLVDIQQIEECQRCEFVMLCAGSCRAMHYAYTGDFFTNKDWICDYLKEELLMNLWIKEGYCPTTERSGRHVLSGTRGCVAN